SRSPAPAQGTHSTRAGRVARRSDAHRHRTTLDRDRPGRLRAGREEQEHPRMTTTVTTKTAAKAAASTYQQLRGHLVDLKLADAADALPQVLDQAQAEGWTLTTALERLLQIEVTATDARRLAGRFRFANLPTGATLDDFDLDSASGIDRSLLTDLGPSRVIDPATNAAPIGPTR